MSYEFRVYSDNSLNDSETLEDAIKLANECIDEYRDNAQDGWSDEVENVCILLETHQVVMINERPRDPEDDAHVSSMCETVCDYELQPTAEWSRIQANEKRVVELEARLEEETLQFSRLYEDLKQTREALRQIVGLVPDYTNPEEYCRQVRLLASPRKDGDQ